MEGTFDEEGKLASSAGGILIQEPGARSHDNQAKQCLAARIAAKKSAERIGIFSTPSRSNYALPRSTGKYGEASPTRYGAPRGATLLFPAHKRPPHWHGDCIA
jgi:hypothetical protein